MRVIDSHSYIINLSMHSACGEDTIIAHAIHISKSKPFGGSLARSSLDGVPRYGDESGLVDISHQKKDGHALEITIF